jgi:hypothetical protein
MRSIACVRGPSRLSTAALLSAALVCGVGVGGASEPAAPQEAGLHVGSPPSVLNDPIVQRCRSLAARRMDPKLDDPMMSAVEKAAH